MYWQMYLFKKNVKKINKKFCFRNEHRLLLSFKLKYLKNLTVEMIHHNPVKIVHTVTALDKVTVRQWKVLNCNALKTTNAFPLLYLYTQ